ncbi:YrrS family protein [Metabacillus endolithicus]|uniref:DUF1510 family protein n=1 Tax=Metabacillus endolithicus TaxID=1535204 RepID=A0ABW5BW56_9BACI|nr:YrrS family protein [Metabacillus endolithicus]UPG64627.1 DUF1510 family protein [Metabacillus endolithicus]
MSNQHLNSSRYEKRDKKRKTNIVLNTLIGIVLVLIFVIGSQLILGANQSEKTAKYNEQPDIQVASEENKAEEENPDTDKEENQKENSDKNTEDGSEEAKQEDTDEDMDQKEETESEIEDSFDEATITEGDPESGIAETIESSGWAPIGTSQSEPHSANYTKGSQDWNEMTKALSYATGIPESDMIIWYLGNNGGPNDAAGTISPKDQSVKYKVYITWVENEGWMPTKIEKLQ